jgi:hypothetical protein
MVEVEVKMLKLIDLVVMQGIILVEVEEVVLTMIHIMQAALGDLEL